MSSPHSSELSHDLDPRIQEELEKLNKASNDINKLELELEGVRGTFRQVLTGSTQQLNALHKSLGSCIDKARPYYDARLSAKEAQQETQDAALRFERACGQLTAAKEMVTLAEEGFFNRRGQEFDPAWQEMLNHATMKVSDAERERDESEWDHENTTAAFNEAELLVKELYKEHKRSINKSKPYFELKARSNQTMQKQKSRVSSLEKAIQLAKQNYSQTLRNLERISDEIHQQRNEAKIRQEMGERSSGVGEETPPEVKESPPEVKESPTHAHAQEERAQAAASTMPSSGEIIQEEINSSDLSCKDLEKPEPIMVNETPNGETAQTKPVVMRTSALERRNSYERAIEGVTSEDTSILERANRLRFGFRRKVSLDSSRPLQHPSYSPSLKDKSETSGQTKNFFNQRSESLRNPKKKKVPTATLR